MPSPTSLSFAGVSGGVLSFYAATRGTRGGLAPGVQPERAGEPGRDRHPRRGLAAGTEQSAGAVLASATTGVFQQVAQLLGSSSSALDLIAPLFTVSVSPGEFGREPAGEGGIALLANFLPGTGSGIVMTRASAQLRPTRALWMRPAKRHGHRSRRPPGP